MEPRMKAGNGFVGLHISLPPIEALQEKHKAMLAKNPDAQKVEVLITVGDQEKEMTYEELERRLMA